MCILKVFQFDELLSHPRTEGESRVRVYPSLILRKEECSVLWYTLRGSPLLLSLLSRGKRVIRGRVKGFWTDCFTRGQLTL